LQDLGLKKKRGAKMAEIKSTIEIIMEKLNKMGISEKDKKEIIKKEAKDLAKRLVARYMEGVSIQDVFKEFKALSPEKKEEAKKALVYESIRKISLYAKHNDKIFDLLQALLNKKMDFLARIVVSIEEELNKEKEKHTRYLLERLKERGISGTAVIPNIEADPEWNQKLKEATGRLHSNLDNLISELK